MTMTEFGDYGLTEDFAMIVFGIIVSLPIIPLIWSFYSFYYGGNFNVIQNYWTEFLMTVILLIFILNANFRD